MLSYTRNFFVKRDNCSLEPVICVTMRFAEKKTTSLAHPIPTMCLVSSANAYRDSGNIREELYVSVLCAMFRWQDRRIHVGPAYAIRPINLREARIDCARPW